MSAIQAERHKPGLGQEFWIEKRKQFQGVQDLRVKVKTIFRGFWSGTK
jgi:hypothetical protein